MSRLGRKLNRRHFPTANTSRGRAQDRARVAGGQDHEVQYEAEKERVSKSKVRETVKKVGNSRKKVEANLEK
ncbi:MAG: DUF3606 domain-containing protein [Rhizobium leguminosarum]|nr:MULTISPECIES: DUF3606 domain-containing protein [Rhizobium]MVO91821.1 DUF3606 domain-containing protein [Rhizobium leguminosarum bv. phaseoli]MBY5905654.1 DUF3606 domain-containing protein [Rhizobium leguminosarum]MBY5912693.1 DUF3606 domain-containing protein [Rhizobium leguminosarum]NNU55727.1 DUF3606 domain-containing protein [Rhizobium indigoferae]WHO82986.1 DUF3606 domain-containing protein [Rhizobium leguminosarum]